MPTQKIDPKVIFASDAPAIDKPPVFSDKTKGWDVSRANDGRPEIKQMNKMQQDTDLKILWLNENSVLPYDSAIDYPDGAVTIKDGSFKQLSSGSWVEFLDDFADKDAVKRGIANRYDSSLTYNSGERVVLTNGDIVKSTIDGNVNDPNSDMSGWINKEKEQDTINSLTASEGVNILSVYGGINDFGVALELAYAKAMETDCRKILIPDGVFSAKTTADLTLTSNFTLEFSGRSIINVDNQVDVINVDHVDHTLYIFGNGASIYPNWTSGSASVSALRLDSRTLSKSLHIYNLNIFASDTIKFTNGINAKGLNYGAIVDCTIQAVNPIVHESAPSGTSTHAMGTEVISCKLHADDTAVTLINSGELGCEGWVFKGGEYFGKTGLSVIDNTTNAAYYPPFLLVDGVHMNAQRFFSLSGLSRVKVANCDLQSQVTANSEFKGLIEFDGIQVFDIDETTAISQANTTGTAPTESLPVYYLRNSTRGRTSAFLEFGIKNYWLIQDAPLVSFDTNVNLTGRVNLAAINTIAFPSEIVLPANAKKVGLSLDTVLKNTQVSTGFSISVDATFNSATGILTLNKKPSIGSVYQITSSILPDNSTINQIKVNDSIGKEFNIVLEASNVTINHSVNLYTPIGVQNKLLYGSTLRVLSYNSDLCRILSVTNHSSILPAPVPANTAAFGIHGQEVYSAGFIYKYFKDTGWVRWVASTF